MAAALQVVLVLRNRDRVSGATPTAAAAAAAAAATTLAAVQQAFTRIRLHSASYVLIPHFYFN
jgi:hypothetical protein